MLARLLSIALLISGCSDFVEIGAQTDRSWSQTPTGDGAFRVRAIAVGANGDACITGGFWGSADFGGGPLGGSASIPTMYIACYDDAGAHRWSRGLSASGYTFGEYILPSEPLRTFGYFSGSLTTDLGNLTSPTGAQDTLVLQHDADGTLLSQQRLTAGGNVQAKAAADTPAGLMIMGHYLGEMRVGDVTLPANPTGRDHSFVVVLDGDTPVVAEAMEGPDVVIEGGDVSATSIVFCGAFTNALRIGGAGVAAAAGGTDAFVGALEIDGTFRWARAIGDVGNDVCAVATTTSDGDLLSGGMIVGRADFGDGVFQTGDGDQGYVARHAPNGELVWAMLLGQIVEAIDVAPDGSIVVCGTFEGALTTELRSAGGTDGFAMGLTPAGEISWVSAVGGPQDDTCTAVSFRPGGVVMAGTFSGEARFGDQVLRASGPQQAYIHRFR